jgi:hypothetical protein
MFVAEKTAESKRLSYNPKPWEPWDHMLAYFRTIAVLCLLQFTDTLVTLWVVVLPVNSVPIL